MAEVANATAETATPQYEFMDTAVMDTPEESIETTEDEVGDDETDQADAQPEGEEGGEDLAPETSEEEKPEVAPAETKQPETPKATIPAPPTAAKVEAVDPYEALGIKDNKFIRDLIAAEKAGDRENFLKVAGTDWSKVSDMDLVRQKAEEKYKDVDDDGDRTYMVNRELSRYDTSSFDEEEARAVKIQLKLDAKEIRNGYIAEQGKYKIPEPSQADPEKAAEQQRSQQAAAEFENSILTDPALTAFETSKSVKFGEGDTAFNYAATDMDVKAILQNGFMQEYFMPQGENAPPKFNTQKFIEDAVFLKNKADILGKLKEHYMMLGERRRDAALRNPGKRTPAAASEGNKGYEFLGDVIK